MIIIIKANPTIKIAQLNFLHYPQLFQNHQINLDPLRENSEDILKRIHLKRSLLGIYYNLWILSPNLVLFQPQDNYLHPI